MVSPALDRWVDFTPIGREQERPSPPPRRRAQRTSTVPCIEGWMWQAYACLPAVANVRAIDTLALLPAMSAGAPACGGKKQAIARLPRGLGGLVLAPRGGGRCSRRSR